MPAPWTGACSGFRWRTQRCRSLPALTAALLFLCTSAYPADPAETYRIVLSRTGGDTPVLLARMWTDRTLPCAGYRIRTHTTRQRDTLSVHITGLVRPSPCLGGGDGAEGAASLGNLGGGRYVLRITEGNRTDLYHLRITRGVPEVGTIARSFTTINH